jgi:hypothetical protein
MSVPSSRKQNSEKPSGSTSTPGPGIEEERRGTSLTLEEIRILLADSIRDLRSGATSPVAVNAVSNATGKYLSSVKLQLDAYKLVGRQPDIDGLVGSALPITGADKPA